jgi:hypothetical protein
MQNPFLRSKCFPLIRLHLALHIVPRILYLGFTLKWRRVPWLWRRTCPLASPNATWYAYAPSTSPFSEAVAGEQVIKIQSSLCLWIFSVFLLIFLLHLLILIILKTRKNQSRVLLNPSFLLVFCSYFLFVFAKPNRRWTATSPTKSHIFCGWSRKPLQVKVTCNTISKSGGRTSS